MAKDNIKRCPKCGAGPLGNCGYHGCETPRSTCPLNQPPQSRAPSPTQEQEGSDE